MTRRSLYVLHASLDPTEKLPPAPAEADSIESVLRPRNGRKIPHAALSYLLAAAVALLAIRLGTPVAPPVGNASANLPPTVAADLQGAAAASFCQLLLDKAGDAQSDLPTVAVMSAATGDADDASQCHFAASFATRSVATTADKPDAISQATVENMSQAEFSRRLRHGPRRALDSHPQAVSMTQHRPYRGRNCYSFLLGSPAATSAELVEIFIDEATQQPVGCRFLAVGASTSDSPALCEWTVSPGLALRDAPAVKR